MKPRFSSLISAFQSRRRHEQPIPSVSAIDVERVARRDFLTGQFESVMSVLRECGDEKWERERSRVQLATLKLANGNLDDLKRHVATAKRDYRDVLVVAEYPEYWRRSCGLEVADEERDRIVDNDWKQYEAWLKR